MSLREIITGRRSVSQFQPTPVPESQLADLLDAAVYAPNHRLTQPWRFIIVTGEARGDLAEARRALALADGRDEAYADKVRRTFNAVPAFVFVIQDQADDAHLREEDYAACCCLTQNLLLLAWEQGVGSVWKTFPDDPILRDFLGLAGRERVVAMLFMGYPAQVPAAPTRRPASAAISYLSASQAAAAQ